MGIGSITSWSRTSSMQMTMSNSTDTKSKSIQDEITDVQREIRKLSTKEEYSVSEKAIEQQKLKQEKSSLDTELKLHQDQLLKSQKREVMMAKLKEERETSVNAVDKKETSADKQQVDQKVTSADRQQADKKEQAVGRQQEDRQGTVITDNSDGTVILKEEKVSDEKTSVDAAGEKKENIETDTAVNAGLSSKEMHTMVSARNSVQRADRQGVVIARIKDGVAIFKGEIDQDERNGVDTEKKQAELEKMEKREQRANAYQFSTLGEANSTVRAAAAANVSGTIDETKVNTENNVIRLFEEDQARQQRFYVSFG